MSAVRRSAARAGATAAAALVSILCRFEGQGHPPTRGVCVVASGGVALTARFATWPRDIFTGIGVRPAGPLVLVAGPNLGGRGR